MKNDRITPDEVSRLLEYEPDTGLLRWRYRPWLEGTQMSGFNVRYAGQVAGTNKKNYVQIVIKVNGISRFFSGQRLAWVLYYGEWPEREVDHRNRNPTDNRIENLRLASHSQNGQNKNALCGAIKFKGVYWMPAKGRYAAQIKANKQWKWLGLHAAPEDAARAYDRAARELHGKFAVTNRDMGLL